MIRVHGILVLQGQMENEIVDESGGKELDFKRRAICLKCFNHIISLTSIGQDIQSSQERFKNHAKNARTPTNLL